MNVHIFPHFYTQAYNTASFCFLPSGSL